MEFEKILIALWLKGECLEHLDDFREQDFMIYPHVFKALSETRSDDLVHIARLSKEPVTALAGLMSDYGFSSGLFTGAYKAMKERRIKDMLSELAKNPKDAHVRIERLILEMRGLDIDAEETIPLPSEEYSRVLDSRHQDEKIFYRMRQIDHITGGIRNKELTVVAARPGVGKTAFALQIGANIAQQGHKVFYFSLEMARVQLIERFVCKYSGIDGVRLKNPGGLSPDDWQKINDAYSMIPQGLRIYESVKSPEQIRKLIEKHKPALVIIDQLSHLRTREFKSVREKYMHLTNMLKDWTTDLDIPIILLAQINRNGQDRLPTLADLKESGSIEEDADNIFVLHKLSREEAENTKVFMGVYDNSVRDGRYPSLIALAKHRNGETKRLPTLYNGKNFCFEEVASG